MRLANFWNATAARLCALCGTSGLTRTKAKNPRWRLWSFIDALEQSSERRHDDRGQRADLDALYDDFDAAYDRLKLERSLEKRRAMALKLRPLIEQIDRMQREVSTAGGEPALLMELRADKIHVLLLRGFEGPCQWSRDQTWDLLAGAE